MSFQKYFNQLQQEIKTFEPPKPYGDVTPQTILDATAQDGFFTMTGGDEIRSAFVDFQYLTELTATKGLENGSVVFGINIMHTPRPATPLLSDGLDKNLVKTEFNHTVQNRNQVLPRFMDADGVVITAFPKDFDWNNAENKITTEQKQYFKFLLDEYSENLKVYHLDKIAPNLVGATATYNTNPGKVFFSIAGQQADKTGEKTWSIWFNDLDNNSAYGLVDKNIDNDSMYRDLKIHELIWPSNDPFNRKSYKPHRGLIIEQLNL